ncbi:MAG: hypothetical protein U1F41_09770 [Burkholderiales bacterium]
MTPRLARSVLAAGAALALALPAHADEAALAARLDQLAKELDAVKAELSALKAQRNAEAVGSPSSMATASTPPAAKPALANDTGAQTPLPYSMGGGSPFANAAPDAPATTIFGYGEASYSYYPKNQSQTTANLDRLVLGIGHRFNDKARFVGEIEVENAVSSADDNGEVAVEQAYIEYSFTPGIAGRAGLFLIPSGILNTAHEPTQYFGVQRNFVETSIIPTTWREGGIGVTGVTDFGLTWDVGITTGFNLASWDPTSDEGKASPLGSIHQELSLAKAANLSGYAAANWRGYPGLLVGGSVFYGKAGQKQPDFPSQDAAVTLAEAHARYTTGPFDFQALYAYGHISDTAPYNLTIVGNPTLVPEAFFGWYLQGAWYAWTKGDLQLAPFVRYEQLNTGWKYAFLGAGLTPDALPTQKVTTLGANFYVTPNIVLKTDYQWFATDSGANRFQLGVGFNY